MNARSVCMTVLMLAGLFGLSNESAWATSMPGSVAQQVRLQGETALMRIKADNLIDVRHSSIVALSNPCDLSDQYFRVVADRVKLQGHLAQWSIQESLLADFRSGREARLAVSGYVEGGATNVVAAAPNQTRNKPRDLIAAPRLELPEFLPAIFR